MASFDNVLYIIGNGFDLHHGVMSSYKSFAIWLQRKNRALYEKLNDVCRVESLWRDFEGALPYVDRAYFLEMGDVWLPEGCTEDVGREQAYCNTIITKAGRCIGVGWPWGRLIL